MIGIININKEICDDQNGCSNHQAEGKQSASYLKNIYKGKHLMETSAISTSTSNQYYVYIYLDPRKSGNYSYTDPETGEVFKFYYEPFYVGMGKGKRWKTHLSEAKFQRKIISNRHKCNIINKIKRETGNDPIILKLYENISLQKAKDIEILYIKIIGRVNLHNGSLVNLTNGGDGVVAKVVSEEWRRNQSNAMKGNKYMLGKKHSKETRSLFSEQRKGSKHCMYGKEVSKETRLKIGNANRNKTRSEEFKIKASQLIIGINNPMYGKHHTEETKAYIGVIHRKYSYKLSNNMDYWEFLNSKERRNIKSLFNYYKSNIIQYKGITIERRKL